MKRQRYSVTLENLTGCDGEPAPHARLQFEVSSHSDILSIAHRFRETGDFSADSAAAFGVGLKLLDELLRENPENPLLTEFAPQFKRFVESLALKKAFGA